VHGKPYISDYITRAPHVSDETCVKYSQQTGEKHGVSEIRESGVGKHRDYGYYRKSTRDNVVG
jgi:hypothetical protein